MGDETPPHHVGDYTIPYRVGLLETALLNEASERKVADAASALRIDSIEDWRAELKGAFRIVTFALGTSVVGMVLGLAALWSLVSRP